eukprot:27810-Hanusia_phi.AAC.1
MSGRKKICDTEAGNICEVSPCPCKGDIRVDKLAQILTITSQAVDPDILRSRKVVAISARVHPGDVEMGERKRRSCSSITEPRLQT